MANARSRGNIPLTDVDKHCDREQGPQLHRPCVSRHWEESRASKNSGETGRRTQGYEPARGAYCFFQVSSRRRRPCTEPLRTEAAAPSSLPRPGGWRKSVTGWIYTYKRGRETSSGVSSRFSLSLSLSRLPFSRPRIRSSRCLTLLSCYAREIRQPEAKKDEEDERRTRTRRGRGRRRSAKLVGVWSRPPATSMATKPPGQT